MAWLVGRAKALLFSASGRGSFLHSLWLKRQPSRHQTTSAFNDPTWNRPLPEYSTEPLRCLVLRLWGNMRRGEFLGGRTTQSTLVVAALVAALTFTPSSNAAEAEMPTSRTGLVLCEQWLSNPGHARHGEIWIYGFWDGLVQGLGYSGRVGQIPNSDVMLDDVRSDCKDKPRSTLANAASRTFERMRQGVFSPGPTEK